MGCAASSKKLVIWKPDDDDGNTAWMEDMDAYMVQFMEDEGKTPTGLEANAAALGLLDPPFDSEGDLEFGPMRGRRKDEWSAYKKALIKDWEKRSSQHMKKLENEGKHEELKAFRLRLEGREMPDLTANAIAIAKQMLFYTSLQMRVLQLVAYREKAKKEQAEQSK